MDEITISGVRYISSRRAAQSTGYVTDYIGQLVRGGKLKAVKVGRAWFVAERGLELIAKNPHIQLGAHSSNVISPMLMRPHLSTVSAQVSFPKTWSDIKYEQDDAPLLPTVLETSRISDSREDQVVPIQIRRNPVRSLPSSPTSMSVDGVRVTVHEHKQDSGHSSVQVQLIQHVGLHQHDHRHTPTTHTIARVLLASLGVALLVFLVPIFV